MFKLTDRFWWPVIFEVPGDGEMQKHRVELEFRRKTQSEMDALAAEAKTDGEICHAVVLGWRGVTDEKNEPLTFNKTNFDSMLNEVAGGRLTVASTYFDVMQGAARRKNLLGLRGIGS